MTEEPDWAADDPEIAALLTFTPVVRKNVRHDGWSPAVQRGFIAWLAVKGKVPMAALAVGKRESGAWTVRNTDALGEFTASWDRALALYHTRRVAADPPPAVRAPPPEPRHAREVRDARARGERVLVASECKAEQEAFLNEVLKRYLLKLQAERNARLDGRIVEADFYVRQLTFIELILDIGGNTQEALAALGNYDCEILNLAATPGSNLLERARRALWQEKGEADRPPPAPLGKHDGRRATGREEYDPERDGDRKDWERRQEEKRKLAAEAQREWEQRARAEHPGDASRPLLGPANDSSSGPSARGETGLVNDDDPFGKGEGEAP